MASLMINFDNIQGNSFGGFNKDFQSFLFLKFKDPKKARTWIKSILGDISPSLKVLAFNAQFKALLADKVAKPETFINVTWANLALSFEGLKALGVKKADLDKFPVEFKAGMASRKNKIGDVGSSDPSKWKDPFNPGAGPIHAVLLVASDLETDLTAKVNDIKATAVFQAGVSVVGHSVEGRTRVDEPGHEHFGFKDGVSQPGIRGVNPPDDPVGNPDQGHPGQDLLWPGEFVLGYPTQKPHVKKGHDGPNPDPGPISKSGPGWTADGSYLVFRRLNQDVQAFRQNLQNLAAANGLSVDLMGAKIVGRYKSGCPVEARKFQPGPHPFRLASVDPGIANLALADDDTLNNNFEFGDDADGAICPLSAHIRKAYPRDELTTKKVEDSESDTQQHRLLRRGIAFGASLGQPNGGGPNDPRGLLFLAYQNSIAEHFEFVQTNWVNNANFPPAFAVPTTPPGQDPIIAQSPQGPFVLPPNPAAISINHFVTTTGGEYFLAPSLDTLGKIGNNKI